MSPDTFIDPNLTVPDLLVLQNLLEDVKNAHAHGSEALNGDGSKDNLENSSSAAGWFALLKDSELLSLTRLSSALARPN